MRLCVTAMRHAGQIMLAALCLAGPGAATAQTAAEAAADQVIETERAFAQHAVDHGTIAAFRAFIDDEGVLFRPDPVNGRAFLAGRENRPGPPHLRWTPAVNGVSASGDLAFNIGPWIFGEDQSHGYFFTIWKRQPGGGWKFLLDHGPSTEARPPFEAYLDRGNVARLAPGRGATGARDAASALEALRAAEARHAAAAARDAHGAYLAVLAEEAWVLDEGPDPLIGRAAFSAGLARRPPRMNFAPLGGGASAAGDFAYSYGEAAWREAGEARRGHYVRVWRREADGWRILADAIMNAPPRDAE